MHYDRCLVTRWVSDTQQTKEKEEERGGGRERKTEQDKETNNASTLFFYQNKVNLQYTFWNHKNNIFSFVYFSQDTYVYKFRMQGMDNYM